MCFAVSIRESRVPLRFCNRYVGIGTPGDSGLSPPELATATSSDVTTALGLLDAVQFAQLHVTSVTARIEAQSGLVQGSIVSASAPMHVRSGQRVRVHLLVRLYRGALRTFSFTIRIPRGLRGVVVARLQGPSASSLLGSGAGLEAQLTAALGGGASTPSGPGPASIADLQSQFSGIARYDGVQLSFGGKHTINAYRNPSLPILGSALLAFNVGH